MRAGAGGLWPPPSDSLPHASKTKASPESLMRWLLFITFSSPILPRSSRHRFEITLGPSAAALNSNFGRSRSGIATRVCAGFLPRSGSQSDAEGYVGCDGTGDHQKISLRNERGVEGAWIGAGRTMSASQRRSLSARAAIEELPLGGENGVRIRTPFFDTRGRLDGSRRVQRRARR